MPLPPMPAPDHPVFAADDVHCCACLASTEHDGFDCTGCEFCDWSVTLVFATSERGNHAIVTTNQYDPQPQFRAWMTPERCK